RSAPRCSRSVCSRRCCASSRETAIRNRADSPPFQALALTIGNRVGVGNIAGVATAIGWGGPGALFWMGGVALCGGATASAESTRAPIYKARSNNERKGGVTYYLHKVFQKRWIGMIAAVTALLLYIILAPGIQSNSIAVTAANSNSPRGRTS